LLLLLFLVVALLFLTTAIATTVYELEYANRIYRGVQVLGVDLGGMTSIEAERRLRATLAPFPAPSLVLRSRDRAWPLVAADLGIELDPQATVAAAFRVGRSGASLWNDLLDQALVALYGRSVQPVIRYDEGQVTYALSRIARELNRPPREANLTVQDLEVIVTPPQNGREVDITATREALMRQLRSGEDGTVNLVIHEIEPAVSDLEEAQSAVKAIVAEPFLVTVLDGEERWYFALDRAALVELLVLRSRSDSSGGTHLVATLDETGVYDFVAGIAAELDQPAQDAKLDFDMEAGQVIVLAPSRYGRRLDVEDGVQQILAAVEAGQHQLSLSMQPVPPRVDSNRVDEMGIVELVAEGTTMFAGSSQARVHNIVAAARKLDGVVVPPGEVFSFNQHVGYVTAANGFEDSLIIWGDRTAVGVGGGVCQVSTTVFRAALFGGFPIVERWAHGYVVSWYGEPGMDATVYVPTVDFKFRNDTDHFLLIKAIVDLERGKLTFRFYGTKPDRTVEVSPPVIENVRPPEKPMYLEDLALPTGTIKQVEWPVDGRDATVRRVVRDAEGKVISDQKFVSHYQPWRAVYLYGPGTKLPKDAQQD